MPVAIVVLACRNTEGVRKAMAVNMKVAMEWILH